MKSDPPKVSVLIPVYNRESLVRECIQSARNQIMEDLEIVVCDNASTDQTWQICQEEAAIDPRIRIFRNEENIGPVRNWMECIKHARGEYSKIVFSDDKIYPDCLEKMLMGFKNPQVGLVYSAVRLKNDDCLSEILLYTQGENIMQPDKFLDLVIKNEAPVSPGAALMRTADLRENLKLDFPTKKNWNFAAHGAGPDVMTMLLTAFAYKTVVHINQPLALFRAHGGSITIRNIGDQIKNSYAAIMCYFLHINNKPKWIKYVSSFWKKRLKAEKKWLPAGQFLRDFEGTGSWSEILQLWIKSMSFSFLKSLFKIARKRVMSKQ